MVGLNLFLQPDSANTSTVFTESPTKKYLHFANFQKAGQPLKEVSLDRQNSKQFGTLQKQEQRRNTFMYTKGQKGEMKGFTIQSHS